MPDSILSICDCIRTLESIEVTAGKSLRPMAAHSVRESMASWYAVATLAARRYRFTLSSAAALRPADIENPISGVLIYTWTDNSALIEVLPDNRLVVTSEYARCRSQYLMGIAPLVGVIREIALREWFERSAEIVRYS